MEIWEVLTAGSNMIFKTEPLIDRLITSICTSHDDHRLFIGSSNGAVRMLSIEDLGSNQSITQDERVFIALLLSEKMVAIE